MADIELIVKIPEELLRYFNSFYLMNVNENKNVDKLVEAIKKGKPLPILTEQITKTEIKTESEA
jgi:hypothetical protein